MNDMNRNLSRQDDSGAKPPQNKPTRRHPGLWPFILIAVGVVFLLDNLGVSTWGVWNALEVWWPLLLIVIGADLLSRSQPWGRWLTLGLAALAAGVMVIWSFNQPATSGNSSTETVSQPLSAARAEIGSGSKSNVSMFGVVAVDKQNEAVEVHPLALREGQGFTHKPSQTLS